MHPIGPCHCKPCACIACRMTLQDLPFDDRALTRATNHAVHSNQCFRTWQILCTLLTLRCGLKIQVSSKLQHAASSRHAFACSKEISAAGCWWCGCGHISGRPQATAPSANQLQNTTHSGILNAAAAVVDILKQYFPMVSTLLLLALHLQELHGAAQNARNAIKRISRTRHPSVCF